MPARNLRGGFFYGDSVTDLTIMVMRVKKLHAVGGPAREPLRWRALEFVDVFPYVAVEDREAVTPVHALLHVTGCPGTSEEVKEFLCAEHRGPDFPGPKGIERGPLRFRRKNRLDFSKLSAQESNEIMTTGHLEMSWVDLTGPGGMGITGNSKCIVRNAGDIATSRDDA